MRAHAVGQQIEILARFSGVGCEALGRLPLPFGVDILVGAHEWTRVAVDQARSLVCVDGRQQGNPQQRCGVLPPIAHGADGHRTPAELHMFVDHSLISLIVNNLTALTVSVTPSSSEASGVQLFTSNGSDVVAEADVYTLSTANDNVQRKVKGAPPSPPSGPPTWQPLLPAGRCQTDADCSLNGECELPAGRCACFPSWQGHN